MKKLALFAMLLGSCFLYGCGGDNTKPGTTATKKTETTTTPADETKSGATTTKEENKTETKTETPPAEPPAK